MLALYVDCAVILVWTSIAFCSMYFCYCTHGYVYQLVIKENDDDDDDDVSQFPLSKLLVPGKLSKF